MSLAKTSLSGWSLQRSEIEAILAIGRDRVAPDKRATVARFLADHYHGPYGGGPMQAFVPAGYLPLNDWIAEEAARRGHDRGDIPNNVYWPIFDDLANYLGNHDTDRLALATCITEHGAPEPMPVDEWKKEAQVRAKLSSGTVLLWSGFFNDGRRARIFVRRDLQLDHPPALLSGTVIDVSAVRVMDPTPAVAPTSARASVKALDAFFRDLDLKHQGKPPPTLDEITKAGEEVFGDRWRRDFRDKRNDLDESRNKKYPNLYCDKPGPRYKA